MGMYQASTDKLGKVNVSSNHLEIPTAEDIRKGKYEVSAYSPAKEENEMLSLIKKHFTLGYQTMYQPRVEFNDLSTLQRMQVDQILFNTYQSNNGDPELGDEIRAWRSRAMRPIVRNKCVSIAAHASAKLIFPKVRAYNEDSDYLEEAAQAMEGLMEYAADKSGYAHYGLVRVVAALSQPASIGYNEYSEVYRTVKRGKDSKGKWKKEQSLDENLSGFQNIPVPVDELFIENFYEPDIQKQGWLIWRRVMAYSLSEAKYKDKYENFKYVREGVQTIYNDANQTFYNVYDPIMRPYEVEEVIYWNKTLDVKIIVVNGVMLTEYDNENPRNDKQYPFDKFYYEIINSRCFYGKSLAFKTQQDASIINTLYPMVVDGSYLNVFRPMIARGGEIISSDVIVPGGVTTFSNPDSNLEAINLGTDLRSGLEVLSTVEHSLDSSSQDPLQAGMRGDRRMTAFEMSRLEQNAETILGLFIKSIASFVVQFGKLRLSDILQYLTVADAAQIDGGKLVYKSFIIHDKVSGGKIGNRKLKLDATMPDEPQLPEDIEEMRYKALEEQGGIDSNVTLFKINPTLFRNLKWDVSITPDVLNPKSEDLERALDLETYDRAINNPLIDQEAITKTLLLGGNPKTKKDPDKFIKEQGPVQQGQQPVQPGNQAGSPIGSPLSQLMGKTPLPQTPTPGNLTNH